MLRINHHKENGAFYTPSPVAQCLVRWAVRNAEDLALDPACGDGSFLSLHDNAHGVERDCNTARMAKKRAQNASVHIGDFFSWADKTKTRFDCVVGNPPFIRYQNFSGNIRQLALRKCKDLGVRFSALASSWAPFLVVASDLLKRGGRLAVVVPAEVGHAPYAAPLIRYLAKHFSTVQFVALREKVFASLSEDVWLLFADGYGETTQHLWLSQQSDFGDAPMPPRDFTSMSLAEWEQWSNRLRPFLLPAHIRDTYFHLSRADNVFRLKNIANVGIGYVTGANDFFHLRPSTAKSLGIPERFLLPTIRNTRFLPAKAVTASTVRQWIEFDEPVLLLRIGRTERFPNEVASYLDGPSANLARKSYKCRNRNPWYAVPQVRVPDGFLSYMSGNGPRVVANSANCSCTNSIHCIKLLDGWSMDKLQTNWEQPLTQLSCELEGHPLGGGMLKLEPGEAGRVLLSHSTLRTAKAEQSALDEGLAIMRRWRHYG